MKVEISKHLNDSHKNWYGTTFDSQMFFKETWYRIDKAILNKYFEIGHNGGSYAINFDSKNFDAILNELNISESDITYMLTDDTGVINEKKVVPKQAYLDYQPTNDRQYFTDWLAPYFKNI